jgi:addiction module HigA family antidote
MILSYRGRRTREFAEGELVRQFQGFSRQAFKRLEILNAATSLADLAGLPSNRLETLRGDRAGQWSIRINKNGVFVSNGLPERSGRRTLRLSTTTRQGGQMKKRPAIHPGEILADELEELGVTPTELSRQIGVPPNRVTQIMQGKRAITGDTALRLGHWFRTSAEFWLNLQTSYDLRVAERELAAVIKKMPTRPEVVGR